MTNYKEVKTLLQQRGYVFESDTDTEVIAKLIHHLWVQHPAYSFRELVEQVVQQLVGIPEEKESIVNCSRGNYDISEMRRRLCAPGLRYRSNSFSWGEGGDLLQILHFTVRDISFRARSSAVCTVLKRGTRDWKYNFRNNSLKSLCVRVTMQPSNGNGKSFQEGAFALCFKSKYFPGECVATRRGSPLLVGIKTKTRLATDHVPILYGKGKFGVSIRVSTYATRSIACGRRRTLPAPRTTEDLRQCPGALSGQTITILSVSKYTFAQTLRDATLPRKQKSKSRLRVPPLPLHPPPFFAPQLIRRRRARTTLLRDLPL